MSTSPKHWFKKRGYLHFDFPIGPTRAYELIESPATVARHSFYPLLRCNQNSVKVSKDPVTGELTKKPKDRPISYAAHKDSAIYSFYGNQLSERYETVIAEQNLHDSVLAFRSLKKTNIHFAKTAFDTIKAMGNCTAIALDIRQFFQHIDHQVLKNQWCKLLGVEQLPPDHYAVFKSITRYASVDREKLYQLLNISPYNPKHKRERICSAEQFRHTVRKSGLIETNTSGVGLPQGLTIRGSSSFHMDFRISVTGLAIRKIIIINVPVLLYPFALALAA
ncbi:hypothetical protein [Endozoicomonas ascidiicola]|uniref:hypothetical protein n=1 Tax=Endozoicomonas ascidiicola TaxID=1698521 RepID=UPI00082BA4CA|nr:hypothetical protein [Endozoicomonas ascidiicola]